MLTAQGISYLDDEDDEQFIDFQQCYENHLADMASDSVWQVVKELNKKTDVYRDEYIQRLRNAKQIGDRNILTFPWEDGPYIEFYTIPPIRFKFGSVDEWSTILNGIRRAGWRTFDHS